MTVFEDVSRLVQGVECVSETGEGTLAFSRLPEDLAERYRDHGAKQVRLECAAAVRVRCRTDARALRIGLNFGAASRPFYQGVVTVDGDAHVVVGPDQACASWDGEVALPGDGLRLVEFWLPHLVRADLRCCEWVEAGTVEAVATPRSRWLVLGDSIAQGMTAPPADGRVGGSVRAREVDLNVRNFGIGGAEMEPFWAGSPIRWSHDLLTVAFGTNDFNHSMPIEEHVANLQCFLERHSREHPEAWRVVLTVPPWVGRTEPNSLGLTLDDYRGAVADCCADLQRTTVVQGPDLIPDDASLFVDGVHPNTAGMAVLAKNLSPHLRTALSAARGQR